MLNPDIINSCRVCRSPNQDGDYQSLFETSSESEEGNIELREAGILYENIFDISLNERNYYPRFLCNSCDLQMKLFMKLKDKALKTLEYLQSLYGEELFKADESIENKILNHQSDKQIISSNELETCQDVLDEYQVKEFQDYQKNEAQDYEQNIAEEFDKTAVDETIYENINYNYKNVDVESELDKLDLNSSYNQVHLEQECLYTEQQQLTTNTIASNMEPNFEGDIEVQIDSLERNFSTKTKPDERVIEESTTSTEIFSNIKLEPILDKNDYVTEIYELIDDECNIEETNLEYHETIEDVIDYDTYTEMNTETSSTYNDIEYLSEAATYDSEDEANQIDRNITNAVKKRKLSNGCKKSRGYKCLTCQLEFKNSQEFKLHRTEVHNENKKCNACSKEFRTTAALQKHVKAQHNDEPAFQCEICNKTFNQKAHFQYHMNHHNNIRNFKCDVCEKAFIAKADLKTHLRLHTGERPYVCNVCGKDYLMMEHLKAHMITHTEQSFSCSVCNKQFVNHKTLRLHVRTIHEDPPRFKCTFCLKPFRRKHHLEYHLKSHQKIGKNLDIIGEMVNESVDLEDLGEEAIDDPGFIYLA